MWLKAGMRQCENESPAVSSKRMPILRICLPTENPGVPFSIMKVESPRGPSGWIMRASTSTASQL